MFSYISFAIRYLFWLLRNAIRRLRPAPDYVQFTLAGEYPDVPQPVGNFIQRRLQRPKISLLELGEHFRMICEDPRPKGVILHLRSLALSLAQLDTLRQMVAELRAAGKRVVAWSYRYDMGSYYLACAADEIILLPGGDIHPFGLQREYVFLADALARVGIQADILPISPYKSAGDSFSRSEMSNEVREMGNWLIDAAYDEIVAAISTGRDLDEKGARELIDATPFTDLDAHQIGAVDHILGEEALCQHLGEEQKPATILTWERALKLLRLRRLTRPGKHIALMSIEGMILDGHSQQPPIKPPIPIPLLMDKRAGDQSVVNVTRQLAMDKRAASVVVYINSRGGSATASESMRLALQDLAKRKPVIVVMGSVAASGGYWISTTGEHIIAQPNSITGSIGVLLGKLVNRGLLDRLAINREVISRGESVRLYDTESAFNEDDRQKVKQILQRIYDLFLERVANSREMSISEVDDIARGRVWTGRQALVNGLIDDVGGLQVAIDKARVLGGLKERPALRMYFPGRSTIPPISPPTEALSYVIEGIRFINQTNVLCLCPLYWEEM